MNDIIYSKLNDLSKSKFRSSFRLSDNDIEYIYRRGISKIIDDCYVFINKRLSIKEIINDGKQTPMRGHPVFIAQHATGTCCRGCLYKWHGISKNRKLNDKEINYIVSIIMKWIVLEINNRYRDLY